MTRDRPSAWLGLALRRSSARNIASVPCRCGQSWTVPGSGPRAVGYVGQQRAPRPRARRRARSPAPRRPPRRSPPAPASRSRRARRRPGRTSVERRGEQRPLERHQGVQVVGAGGASAPRVAGAARRGRCTGRRPAPGRRRRPASGGAVPSAVTHAEHAVGAGQGPARPARRGGAAARPRPAPAPRSAASAASSAALPPGPAHRSSQRSSRPSTGAAASASATSCEPSSWTPARPSATAGTSPGSPPASTTP